MGEREQDGVEDDEWVHRRYDMHGVPIKVTDRGVQIDSDRWIDRILRKISWTISNMVMSCVVTTVLFGTIFCFVGGLAVYITITTIQDVQAKMPAGKPPVTWDGSAPLVCKGNDVLAFSDVEANLPGVTAVIAKNNCQLTLRDVTIVAGTGIQAETNAVVTVHGGHVEGSVQAVDATVNAVVSLLGTEVVGETTTKNNATINGP